MRPKPASLDYDAYIAERNVQAAAIAELGLTEQQIQAIHDYFNANVDTLFSALSVSQRRFLKVTMALVKALAKQAIKNVR